MIVVRSRVTVLLQASKQYATTSQRENKRHGHEVRVNHDKTWTLSYLQKTIWHAQKDMARLQIITVSGLAEITSGCNVWSYQTTCYMKLSWQMKAWHANTKDRGENSFSELIPKVNRKDGSIHANMALRQKASKHQSNTSKQVWNMIIWNFMQNQASFI